MKSPQRSTDKAALEHLHRYLSGYVQLTRQEFNSLLPYLEIREFDKKVQVIRQGDVEKYINIVARGILRKYLPLRKEEVTVQLATEGHIIHSELSFYSRGPSATVIESIEPVTLISVSYDNLQLLYEHFPKAERLGRLLVSDLFIKKDFRYFEQLQQSTRERFIDYVRTHPQMLQRVPQKYIASYLNIKPETFSRLKHLLQPQRKAK